MAIKDPELQARQDIVEKVKTSFFVEAGAGSGKTTKLVERMVSMIESGIKVSEISAITFTKAAANEFYARFQKALAKKQDNPLCVDALKDIDLCFMGTIDSFCNMILSEHPSAVNIPSNATNVTKEELEELYKTEFSKIRAGEYGKELQELCKDFVRFNSNPQEVFVKTMEVLMSKRNADIVYKLPTKNELDTLFNVESEETINALKVLIDNQNIIKDSSNDTSEAKDNLLKRFNIIKSNWSYNIPNIIYNLKTITGLNIKKDNNPGDYDTYLGHIFKENNTKTGAISSYVFDENNFVYYKLLNYQYSISIGFVAKCIEPIAKTLKEQGKLDFFDYILYLRDTLKEDASKDGKLINHIYNRHKYFLIDEFQDTNPIQAEIFFYLTATNLPQEDFANCIPHPGSLFIVGDPKQSIYRFRDADVSSFIKIRKLFENPKVGEVVNLTRNFRSTNKLCEFFNEEFSKLFVPSSDQAGFVDIPPVIDKIDDPDAFNGVYKYELEYFKSKKETPLDKQDPYVIANMIRRIMENKNLYIEKGKSIQFKDFMVLTRTTTHLKEYMKAFRENEIPFKVEGETLFNDCEAFKTVVSIIGAIAYPQSKSFIYNALTNALFNEKEENIIINDISAIDINSSLVSLKELSKFYALVKDKSPSAIYQEIIRKFELFKHVDSTNMEYLFYGLELLRTKELDSSVTSIEEAYDYLDSLLDSNKDVERCMSLELNDNKVHLANVHKVKGLERPIVILADPTMKSQAPSTRTDYSNGKPELYVFDISKGENKGSLIKTNKYLNEMDDEKFSQEAEKLRLLYVAATRARNVLIVGKKLKAKGESADSLWVKIVDDIKEDIETLLRDVKLPEIKGTSESPDKYYKTSSVLLNNQPRNKSYEIVRPSMLAHSKLESQDTEYKPSKNTDATIKGTMVHKLMEVLVSSDGALDTNQLIDDIVNEFDGEDRFKDVLIKVANTILNGGYKQINGAPDDILKEITNVKEKYTEVPFAYKESDKLYNGVIDLLYKKDNMWHVIDYKTNYDDKDLDNLYKNQLDSYIKAFKKVSNEDIDSKIYHIDIKE